MTDITNPKPTSHSPRVCYKKGGGYNRRRGKRHGSTTSTRAASGMTDAALKPYQVITDRILALLEQGTVPWRKPWADTGAPKSLASGKAYRGVNTFLLAAQGAMTGYASPYWITFKQALERGGHVRKGEKSTPVVFWKILQKGGDGENEDHADEDAAPGMKRIPMLRLYNVFNVEQCDGVEYPKPEQVERPFTPIETCEQIVQAMPRPPTIEHLQTRAFYRPADDTLNMPRRELFESPEEYYSTLFHELAHATGHESRLARESLKEMSPFGSPTYAKEELLAEMSAAFLCGRAGIEQRTIENSAAYLQGWIAKLRAEPKLVILAAAGAQKAANFILNERYEDREAAQEAASSDGVNAAALRAREGR